MCLFLIQVGLVVFSTILSTTSFSRFLMISSLHDLFSNNQVILSLHKANSDVCLRSFVLIFLFFKQSFWISSFSLILFCMHPVTSTQNLIIHSRFLVPIDKGNYLFYHQSINIKLIMYYPQISSANSWIPFFIAIAKKQKYVKFVNCNWRYVSTLKLVD